jgi:general secretion pathway protein H
MPFHSRRSNTGRRVGEGIIWRSDGFTLVELVLVVIIIAAVLAVSYPMLSRGTASFRLRATARDLINTMRYAREKAITEQKVMRIVADREAQKILLTDELGEDERAYPMPKEVRIQGTALMGREILDEPLVIRFLPNGSAESAEILLVSDKGASLKVATDAITGGARMIQESGGMMP